jgi:hypothetical protein
MAEYEKLFKDEDFCKGEILEARKLFGNINATFDQYQNLIKGLMIMLVHCPDKLVTIVQATIKEAEKRQFYQVNRMLDSLL